MKLLLDNNLSPRLRPLLEVARHDVTHVRDLGLAAAPDHQVLTLAREEQRVLVSADTDFGTILARTGDSAPSVVPLRQTQGRRAAQIAGVLTANLPHLKSELAAGAVVVIRDDNLRIRRLPFAPGH